MGSEPHRSSHLDGMSSASPLDGTGPWYHGSPLSLRTLLRGSTITPDRDLARVFSHSPTLVSDEGEGAVQRFKHNGTRPGFLYLVEGVRAEDIFPHPHSSMEPGREWVARRDLPLRLLGATEVVPEEIFTEAEHKQLMQRRQ